MEPLSRRTARKRKDQAHQISRALVNAADVVVFEALETKEMTSTQNPKSSRRLRRDILDISWAQIETFTAYKAGWEGKRVVRVNPAYTSQTCSSCGHTHPLNRKGDAFACRSCGHTDDADTNAAKNIQRLGTKALLQDTPPPPKKKRAKKNGRGDDPSARPEGAANAPMNDETSALKDASPRLDKGKPAA